MEIIGSLEAIGITGTPVAEIQGDYGPITVSESLVQKIWLRQDFLTENLELVGGESLKVIHPGRWNLREGPDFLEAQLEINGQRVQGDVEIHFYPEDWLHHGHQHDPNFADVVLHVVLFPAKEPAIIRGVGPSAQLELIRYLEKDIESYASDESLKTYASDRGLALQAYMQSMSPAKRLEILQNRARLRWNQKVRFARQRISKHGWEQACHQYFLEVLGYARNRAPMSSIALNSTLAQWSAGQVDADRLYLEQIERWKLAGVRPANHPRMRLQQYQEMMQLAPNWPERLLTVFESVSKQSSAVPASTAERRRTLRFASLRRQAQESVVCECVGGTRLDTLFVDAFWALYSAQTQTDCFEHWYHWFVGDMPAVFLDFLRDCELMDREHPKCNGLIQGVLQLFYEDGSK